MNSAKLLIDTVSPKFVLTLFFLGGHSVQVFFLSIFYLKFLLVIQVWPHDRQCSANCNWNTAWERCSGVVGEMPSVRDVWQVLYLNRTFGIDRLVSTLQINHWFPQHCHSSSCSEYEGALQTGACWHTLGSILFWVHHFRGSYQCTLISVFAMGLFYLIATDFAVVMICCSYLSSKFS